MFGKKKDVVEDGQDSEQPDSYYKGAQDWENDKQLQQSKSETKAWRVAGVAIVVAIVCVASIAVLVSRHKPFAFLVTVDKHTGETSTIRQIDENAPVDYETVADKHDIKRYIEARESYYYQLLQRDYDLTRILSCDDVRMSYEKLYDGEKALDTVLGAGVQYRVKVLSVRLPNDEPGKAVVSYERITKKSTTGESEQPMRFVATLSYKKGGISLTENEWIENPRGFKVCAYRSDTEYSSQAK